MFTADRIFTSLNQKTGVIEWYFQAREGDIGPYKSRAIAESVLKDFINTCSDAGNTGGRLNDFLPSEVKVQNFLNFESKGDLNWV